MSEVPPVRSLEERVLDAPRNAISSILELKFTWPSNKKTVDLQTFRVLDSHKNRETLDTSDGPR
jgi:hypothetical protein